MALGVVVKASQNGQGRESCERAKREKATEKVGVPGSLFVFRGCLSLSVAVFFSCAFSAVLWSAKARSLCGRKKIKVRKRREKDAVTDKETMFPFRSNTRGKKYEFDNSSRIFFSCTFLLLPRPEKGDEPKWRTTLVNIILSAWLSRRSPSMLTGGRVFFLFQH